MAAAQSTVISKAINLVGQRFGRVEVIAKAPAHGKSTSAHWLCRCDCGKEFETRGESLRSGRTQSCGCLARERRRVATTVHGKTGTGAHRSWNAMLARCRYSKGPAYHRYGGRGIEICQRWKASFLAFLEDMGERPEGYTLERIDNDGPYSPENCRWATMAEQCRNKSDNHRVSFGGEDMVVSDWAARLDVSPQTLYQRIKRWGIERALTTVGPIVKAKTDLHL